MDALEALKTRRSIRKFKDQKVSESEIAEIIDCGRLAPSGRNIQPWEFVVVTEKDRRRRLAELATHGSFIADAPVCIAVFSREGRHQIVDGAAATTNMLLAIRALGLASCWVAGYNMDYAPEVEDYLGVPDDCGLIALLPVGYPAVENPDPPRKRALEDVLHREQFGG